MAIKSNLPKSVKSIQRGTVTFGAGDGTKDATISPVNTTKCRVNVPEQM